jgi:hypothetical protein
MEDKSVTERYIVQGQLGDGNPGYWNNREWWADRDKAKIYKSKASANKIAREYGGQVRTLTSRIDDATDTFKLKRLGIRKATLVAECDHLAIGSSKKGAAIVTRTGGVEYELEIPADQISSVIERLQRCKNLNDRLIGMRDVKC